MNSVPALVIPLGEIRADLAGAAAPRGDRKLLVTRLYREKERLAKSPGWRAPGPREPCAVLETQDTEVAVFNHSARQDRHRHQHATEIYSVIEGAMLIEVEGVDYRLAAGDIIVIRPGVCHAVKPEGSRFLCCVVAANCRGKAGKELC